jgi:hypothetical protein
MMVLQDLQSDISDVLNVLLLQSANEDNQTQCIHNAYDAVAYDAMAYDAEAFLWFEIVMI